MHTQSICIVWHMLCPNVCLSVASQNSVEVDEGIEMLFGIEAVFSICRHCVVRELWCLQK